MSFPSSPGPIGVFDSGYGGLTILHGIRQLLPQYDYIYLGDNARAPYGSRSFEVVYQFTRQAVLKLFSMGCHLVILGSYKIEIQKLFPDVEVTGVACPLWAAIVEAGEADSPGADYFVKKRIDQLMRKDSLIDTVILGCTHYPLLMSSVVKNVPDGVRIMAQGTYVADSLADYLNRHPEMEQKLTQGGTCRYFTTESEERFRETARIFLHEDVNVQHVEVTTP